MASPKIAIIGAGPVGTILARLLHFRAPSVSVTVFEGDVSPNYRSQGGTLDLHTATGLSVLKEADLMDEFLKHARYDGESLKITDKNLKIYHQIKPSETPEKKGGHLGGQRPEIDRGALRKLLVESLPEGMVRWGHKLKEVKLPAKDGFQPRGTQLVFTVRSEGSSATTRTETTLDGFDLIVGADGAWSKIRSGVLSSTKPFYSGVTYHELNVPEAAKAMPDVHGFVNHGSVFAHVDGHMVALQQMGDGSINIAVSYRADDEEWALDKARCGFDATDLEETKAALLQRLTDWHPLIKEAVSKASGRTLARPLYMLPVGFHCEHRRGLTVIGDAAHVMTPFAGEGVNVGMEDARRLAHGIVAAGDDLDKLNSEVAKFEADMVVRAGLYAKLTDEMLHNWFFTTNSPKAMLPKMMGVHLRFHAPTLLKPLAGWFGYGYGSYKVLVTG